MPLSPPHSHFDQLIETLKVKVKGWPVPLTDFYANKAAAESSNAGASGGNSNEKQQKEAANDAAAAPTSAGTPWLHLKMKKAEADERLTGMGNKDGNFLVRGPEDKRVLSVVYKGAPTHHLVKVGEDGNLVLNKRAFGTTPSIAVLVETLKTAQKGWPVPLSGFYANPDEIPPPAPAPAPAAAAPATKEQAAPPAAAEADAADNDDPAPKDDSGADSAGESALPATHSATTEETSFGAPPPVPGRSAAQGPPAVVVVPTAYEDTASLASINGLGNSAAALPPWLHFSIQDTEAQQLLESAGLTDGLFLVRPTVQESYVLDLVVRGMLFNKTPRLGAPPSTAVRSAGAHWSS